MTFMILNIDSYDILLGLDFLIKIGAIVDVEWGLIYVWRGPRTNVHVLTIDNGKYVIKVEHWTRLTATFKNIQIATIPISYETFQ